MKLNNGTKWGLGIGVVLAIVAIFALGIENPETMGSTMFGAVVGGAIIGTVFGMIAGMK
jgi:fucose permease